MTRPLSILTLILIAPWAYFYGMFIGSYTGFDNDVAHDSVLSGLGER